MLEIELRVIGRGLGEMARYTGQFECVRGGRLADYRTVLLNSDDLARDVVRIGEVERYPRWSEPIEALLARGINEALRARAEDETPPFRLMSISTSLHGTLVSEVQATYQEHRLFAGAYEIQLPPTTRRPGPWGCAALRLAYEAWDAAAIPPMPEPAAVPVYRTTSDAYCRIAELPLPAQACFRRWSFGRGMPTVAGVDDAVFAADVAAFFG